MPTSEARLIANRANAARSTGPKTEDGKARSRANALKHGLTGEGVVLAEGDSAEVERLSRSFEAELNPSGEVGRVLVRRMALMSVRMDRCAGRDTANLADRIDQALADFDAAWPEVAGTDGPRRAIERGRAADLARFDTSREGIQARKYETAAERAFFRSLKELRQVERAAKPAMKPAEVVAERPALGSFSPAETPRPAAVAPPRVEPPKPSPRIEPARSARPLPVPAVPFDRISPPSGAFELPFAIGRGR